MARLLVKTEGLGLNTLELRLGVNRVGRDSQSDFPISHPTVSTHHAELILSADGVVLHDCQSTNGTFVNGQPVSEVWLEPGHQVRFGDVELLVESTEASITIPVIERNKPAPPPVVLADGAMICPRHPEYLATFKCTVC
jgi:pSer/pThr/pTyr-binding forkhead associated (FHA) protein